MKNVLTFFFLFASGALQAQTGKDVIKTETKTKIQKTTFSSFLPEGLLKPDLSTAMLLNNSASIFRSSANKIESATKAAFKYSMLMNVEVESLNNFTLYHFIDQWFGTPYQFGGNSKTGIDCSSFTASLFENIYSMILPRKAKEQYKLTRRIKKEELKEGDLVFFNTVGGISHVGVFLANGNFVHSSSSQGVTISNLSDAYYSKRYRGAGRIIQ